nr:Fanconi anemia core complex-associated protein 20-like [Nerophis lumbriciformis]
MVDQGEPVLCRSFVGNDSPEEQLAEQQWYNLTEKVPPSPKPPPMSPQKTDFPVTFPPETKTQLDIADSSHSSVSRQDCGIAGPSRIEEGMKQDEKRQTVRGSCFDSQTLVKDADIIEELMESEENEEKVIDSKSGEQAQEKLNSCPMCLLVFPVEASQMDRDCHLAQCLSEMNVDMSW